MKILLSAGPIPGKLDSVKIITNKFKGGLALKTADMLVRKGHDVNVVAWQGTDIRESSSIHVTRVADIHEYYKYIEETEADAYILVGAIANLIPVNPWKGQFPSHEYKVGEEFDIKFTIAPRIIDMVKKAHPRSTLIGYKLFDGSEEELIAAGWETLVNSKSNVVFCNHPETAKSEKIALMPDGTKIKMNFDEHVDFIDRVVNLKWYSTHGGYYGLDNLDKHQEACDDIDKILSKIGLDVPPYMFGTVAVRDGTPSAPNGFITTTRGKSGIGNHCKVSSVDHDERLIRTDRKATMNAPFIDKLFKTNPDYNCIIHGHQQLDPHNLYPCGADTRVVRVKTYPYAFSGTLEETKLADDIDSPIFNITGHGYYAIFKTPENALKWAKGGLY